MRAPVLTLRRAGAHAPATISQVTETRGAHPRSGAMREQTAGQTSRSLARARVSIRCPGVPEPDIGWSQLTTQPRSSQAASAALRPVDRGDASGHETRRLGELKADRWMLSAVTTVLERPDQDAAADQPDRSPPSMPSTRSRPGAARHRRHPPRGVSSREGSRGAPRAPLPGSSSGSVAQLCGRFQRTSSCRAARTSSTRPTGVSWGAVRML